MIPISISYVLVSISYVVASISYVLVFISYVVVFISYVVVSISYVVTRLGLPSNPKPGVQPLNPKPKKPNPETRDTKYSRTRPAADGIDALNFRA